MCRLLVFGDVQPVGSQSESRFGVGVVVARAGTTRTRQVEVKGDVDDGSGGGDGGSRKGGWRENWQTAKIRAKEWYTTKDENCRMDRLGVETKTRRRAVGRERVEGREAEMVS